MSKLFCKQYPCTHLYPSSNHCKWLLGTCFICSFVFFHLKKTAAGKNNRILSAVHANRTPKLRPITECVSNMIVLDASTILYNGHA